MTACIYDVYEVYAVHMYIERSDVCFSLKIPLPLGQKYITWLPRHWLVNGQQHCQHKLKLKFWNM